MFRKRFRILRTIIGLASRPALLLLLWTHRHTVGMWWRSLRAEWERGGASGRQDVDRWRRLVTDLGRATVQADPAAPPARVLVVDDRPDVAPGVA